MRQIFTLLVVVGMALAAMLAGVAIVDASSPPPNTELHYSGN